MTGATGMVGRHISAALQSAGVEVVPVSQSGLNGSAIWDLAEWQNEESLDAIFPKIQVIIHAGALISSTSMPASHRLFDVNVRACANIAQWALKRNIPIVYLSSGSVYANPDGPSLKEDALRGWNNLSGSYGMSKLLAEDIFDRFRSQGLKVAIVRPSVIFGFGGSKGKLPYRFLDLAVCDDVIRLTPPVDDRIDFIHAADLATAIVKVIEKDFWRTINIASGRPVSVRELAISCVNVARLGRVEVKFDDNLTASVNRFFLDTKLAQEQLGWSSKIGIQEGLNMVLSKQLIALKG